MDEKQLRELLTAVKDGKQSVDGALRALRALNVEDLGFARIDHHRPLRCGAPEVIFCEGKSTSQVASISESIVESGADLLATRATHEQYEAVREKCPEATYRETARCIVHEQQDKRKVGRVAIVTAGTSDLPVAEEARITCELMGNNTDLLSDVGVAGIHRLLAHTERLQEANVLVVAAGMEGALAGVVGGLVAGPVIGVPTSVGYGASFEGLAPLLTMLNSCADGVSVVNIDNGYGAGYLASMINHLAVEEPDEAEGADDDE